MKESSGRASSLSTDQRPVNGSDPVEEKRETMLGWNDLENMVGLVQMHSRFDHLCDVMVCVTSRSVDMYGAIERCRPPWMPMTTWPWTRCRRGFAQTAWHKAQRRSLTSLPLDERFNILFLGRDKFSCSVLRQLHAAKGMTRLSVCWCLVLGWIYVEKICGRK